MYSSRLQLDTKHSIGKREKTGAEGSPESMRLFFAEGGWGRIGHELKSVLQKVEERSPR